MLRIQQRENCAHVSWIYRIRSRDDAGGNSSVNKLGVRSAHGYRGKCRLRGPAHTHVPGRVHPHLLQHRSENSAIYDGTELTDT